MCSHRLGWLTRPGVGEPVVASSVGNCRHRGVTKATRLVPSPRKVPRRERRKSQDTGKSYLPQVGALRLLSSKFSGQHAISLHVSSSVLDDGEVCGRPQWPPHQTVPQRLRGVPAAPTYRWRRCPPPPPQPLRRASQFVRFHMNKGDAHFAADILGDGSYQHALRATNTCHAHNRVERLLSLSLTHYAGTTAYWDDARLTRKKSTRFPNQTLDQRKRLSENVANRAINF